MNLKNLHTIKPYFEKGLFAGMTKDKLFEYRRKHLNGNGRHDLALEDRQAVEEFIYILSFIIAEAEKYIYISEAELCSKIWNDDKIVQALKKTKADDIRIVFGPEFDCADTGIMEIVKQKNIRLYFSSKRRKKRFIVTEKNVLVEDDHEHFTPVQRAVFATNSPTYSSAWKNIFRLVISKKKVQGINLHEIVSIATPRYFDISIKDNNRAPNTLELEEFIRATNNNGHT